MFRKVTRQNAGRRERWTYTWPRACIVIVAQALARCHMVGDADDGTTADAAARPANDTTRLRPASCCINQHSRAIHKGSSVASVRACARNPLRLSLLL